MINFPFFNTEKLYMLNNIDVDLFYDKGFLSLKSVEKHLVKILKNEGFLSNEAFSEDDDDDFAMLRNKFKETEDEELIKNHYRIKIGNGTSCYVIGGLYETEDDVVELGLLFVEDFYSETYTKFVNIENLHIVDLIEVEIELKNIIDEKILDLQKEIDFLKL